MGVWSDIINKNPSKGALCYIEELQLKSISVRTGSNCTLSSLQLKGANTDNNFKLFDLIAESKFEDTPLRLFSEGFSFSKNYEDKLAKSDKQPNCYCGRGASRDMDRLFRLGEFAKPKVDRFG